MDAAQPHVAEVSLGPGELLRFEAFVENLTLLDGSPFVLESWQRRFLEDRGVDDQADAAVAA